ncbi:MAG: histidinol-phosphate transaminase [Nitrospirae bacterium]|nr:histidinol-phosphate transaminase [Nitrospirota bacterium]
MDLVAENIKTLIPYSPGKPIEELERELGIKGSIKLASNENPLGPSRKAIEVIRKVVENIHRYPDGGGYYLKRTLSERHEVKPEQIILGNGSNEVIEIFVRTFLRPGDEAIMASPSFVVYPMVIQAAYGMNVIVPLKEGRHNLDGMVKRVTDKTRMVFIANPNNPTGTINTETEFDSMMKNLPEGVLVVVDEAYYEYVTSRDYPDTMKYLREGRNIIILRTFSKIYGLAGLRIGYGITKKEFVNEMNKVRQPFNINSLAQIGALAALSDYRHVEESRRINEEGKMYLYKELNSMGVKYLPTEANFIYIDIEGDAFQLYERFLKEGVIVRPMGQRNLRVTIGLPDENRRFIKVFRKTLNLS